MPGTWDQMVPRLPCSTEPFSSETQRQLASSSKTELTSTVPPDLPVPPARVWTECLVLRSRACSLHRYTWAVRGGSRRWFSVWLITMPTSMPRCVCGGVGNGHLLISATICRIQPWIFSLSLSLPSLYPSLSLPLPLSSPPFFFLPPYTIPPLCPITTIFLPLSGFHGSYCSSRLHLLQAAPLLWHSSLAP